MEEKKYTLMFDPNTLRIGCVIIQAAYGLGENNFIVSQYFDPKTWIVGEGIQELKRMEATLSQWQFIARKCEHEKIVAIC